MGVNSLPKTVTRQRRDCDLNPGPTAPESSTLTTRLASRPFNSLFSRTMWVSRYQKVEPVWIAMRQEMVGFSDAVASAGPRANNLHIAPDRQPHQHLINSMFTGQMLFLTPNQQCQSTEGNSTEGSFEE